MSRIEVSGVSKRYGSVQALQDVSVSFGEDIIYGLLGRNGAGKSTLLNIITGRIFADEGNVLVDGRNAVESDFAQGQIYLMSEKTLYPESMKISEALRWSKNFYPAFDTGYAEALADKFQLDVRKKVKALSTGYNSIFKNIIALSAGTPFVLLDEPVLGLDANHRDLFYKLLIENYSRNPRTIVISTHLIEEVASVINHVVIIKEGRILKDEPAEALLAGGYTVSGPASAVDRYTADKNVIGSDSLGGLKTAYILGQAEPAGLPEGLEITKLDLQKLFIQLTNA